MTDFAEVTERTGDGVTQGQIADQHHRYTWAVQHCSGRRVIEVACGTGQGLGLLATAASHVIGCDLDAGNVAAARSTYGSRFPLHVASADALPIADGSVDVVLLFEAIYYLPDVPQFLRECRRVLAPGGRLLITSNNPDLFDFSPSPFSHRYFGAVALRQALADSGFDVELFGYSLVGRLPLRHRVLRPAKAVARRLGLVPKTMRGKRVLRRLLFGKLPKMPADLTSVQLPFTAPHGIPSTAPALDYRFIYALAKRRD